MATVLLDTNAAESPLLAPLAELLGGDAITRRRLDIGDVHVVHGDTTIIVERKTWGDLVASLRDGRWSEQKLRLLAARERAAAEGKLIELVYAVESAVVPSYDGATRGVPNANAFAALTKLALRDRALVLYSSCQEHTAKTVAYIAKTLVKDGFSSAAKVALVCAEGYAGVAAHSSKRKNADENVWESMIGAVKGFSGKKAAALADAYPSPGALAGAYAALRATGASDKCLDTMIADILVGGRRLGPALSATMRKLFA